MYDATCYGPCQYPPPSPRLYTHDKNVRIDDALFTSRIKAAVARRLMIGLPADDYAVWSGNFGASAAGLGASVAVPEPVSMILLLAATIFFLPPARRK